MRFNLIPPSLRSYGFEQSEGLRGSYEPGRAVRERACAS